MARRRGPRAGGEARKEELSIMHGLRLILATAAVVGVAACPPLAAINQTRFPTNLVGPNSPPLADTPGLGTPNPATDTPIGLGRTGTTITITSPWTCNGNSVKNQFLLSNPDNLGRYRTVSRFSENLDKTQQVTITNYDAGGEPIGFQYQEIANSVVGRTGIGTLISSQNNGIYDTLELQTSGGEVLTTLSLSTFNTPNSSTPNYISFPWAQTAVLGGKTACSGSNPQVFLPVASNGHIIFDLDGNGVPDPDLFTSPQVAPLGIAAVPTLAPIGLVLLAGLLLTAAVRLLRRQSAAGSLLQS
jgi:hypothetical protein